MFGIVDCNNFYASCERVFNPKLNNKPIVVLSNNDGCVIARSNEAKEIGIKMGEPAFKISFLIEKYDIKIFSTNFALYGDMSKRVMNIIADSMSKIEVYSIDEAFIDLSHIDIENIKDKMKYLRIRILQETGIPVSIGIGKTKTLAKISNHISKKELICKGIFMINNNNIDRVLKKIDVGKVWGVGLRTEAFLKYYSIKTAFDLKESNHRWMKKNNSINGERIIKELRGIICYPLDSYSKDKKSICTSRTFGDMVTSLDDLNSSIAMYTARCAEKLRLQNSSAMLAHIFISTNPFRNDLSQYRNSRTINFPVATNDTSEMLSYISKALKYIYKDGYYYKRAGVVVSGIIPSSQVQCNIFDSLDRLKSHHIMKTVDCINNKMGRDFVRYASQGYFRKWRLKQESLSPSYTTNWNHLLKININSREI